MDARTFMIAVRELLTAEPPDATRNAFRLESWNDWPERWRAAYQYVQRMIDTWDAADRVGMVALSDSRAAPIPQGRIAFGPGKRFDFAVVGEASYLGTLQRAAGEALAAGETVVLPCLVVAEPENAHDPDAIAVYLEGFGKVGYFPREAPAGWEKVAAMLVLAGAAGTCEGYLRGGFGEKTNIGVWLSLRRPEDLLAEWDRLDRG